MKTVSEDPDLISWFDPSNRISPSLVSIHSEKLFIWRCPNGHVFHDTPALVARRKRKCTVCTSFAFCFPEMIKWWTDWTISPEQISFKSGKKLKWKCDKGHFFDARVDRIAVGDRCPYCSGHKVAPENSLECKYPHLLDEWDYDKNAYSPALVTVSSRKKAHWICRICSSSYIARIDHRTVSGSACPFCKLKNETEVYQILKIHFPNYQINRHCRIKLPCYRTKRRYCDFLLTNGITTIMVEYDGIQHFKPVKMFGGDARFATQQEIDNLDEKCCKENDIILCRVKYNDDKEEVIKNLKQKVESRVDDELRK